MDAILILNPFAGSATSGREVRSLLGGRDGWRIWPTEYEGHAEELAARAIEEGADRVVAAGGDGTIHEIVNGMMRVDDHDVPLGIVPVGTGNDLARTLDLPVHLIEAIEVIEEGHTRTIDLIRAEHDAEGVRYAVNAANGGNSELTQEVLDEQMKQRWGPMAYLFAALRVVQQLNAYSATVEWPEGSTSEVDLYGVAIANGNTLGGGVQVAPHANPSDGLFDVVVLQAVSGLELLRSSAKLLSDITDDDATIFRCVPHVTITADPPIWFNLDGEPFARGDVCFTNHSEALMVTTPSEERAAHNADLHHP